MIWVIMVATIVLVIVAGLLGGVLSSGQQNGHHMPSVISRVLDWLF